MPPNIQARQNAVELGMHIGPHGYRCRWGKIRTLGEHLVIEKTAPPAAPVLLVRQNSNSGTWRVFDNSGVRSLEAQTIKELTGAIIDCLGIPKA
jgi:hypothetical protein